MRAVLPAALLLALAGACKKNQEGPASSQGSSQGSSGGSQGSSASAAPPPADASAVPVDAAQAAQTPAPIDSDKILATEAIGPLTIGMTEAAATKVLGANPAKSPAEEEGATGEFVSDWSWPGIMLGMASDKRTGPFTVRSITLGAPSTYATRRGIKIGSSLADVARAYPKSDEGSDDPTLFLVGSVYGGMLFETRHDVVVKVFLGAMAF